MNGVLETDARQTDVLVVEMVSDLICPWWFVAKRRVEKAAALLGKEVEVHWLPFELNSDMPVDGLDRRVYRSTKFGSWEQSQRLDAQVTAAGAEVGIAFHHDLMKRTPNTFRGHVLLAAALKQGLQMQGKVAERLFQAYFVNGEDVGDPAVLLGVAREFGSRRSRASKTSTARSWWPRSRLPSAKSQPASREFLRSLLVDEFLRAVHNMKSG